MLLTLVDCVVFVRKPAILGLPRRRISHEAVLSVIADRAIKGPMIASWNLVTAVRSRLEAFVASQLEFAADPGAFFVNCTSQSDAIQCGAPAVSQARHAVSAVFIGGNELCRDLKVAKQHGLLAAAAGLAVAAGHFCDIAGEG